ncbi:MAG TPA: 3-oxoacyl-ACP reductase FabG [Armatimonadetes bacterium]|nr:3-oxoacyl-ACP reductase FabG [Armatimonadota bacterium]
MALEGKVALVTGSSRGIGRGCALELARAGARVTVNYRRHSEEAAEVAALIRDLGREALVVQADVSRREEVERLVAATVERWGRIDILVNNVAHSIRKPFLELTEEDMRQVLDASLMSVFFCSQEAARDMVRRGEGGSIIVISSVHSFIPFANSLPYNTAKAGINQMAYTLAVELAEHRIRVNVIEPGWIDTPGEREFRTEEQIQAEGRKLPWGRLGRSEEIGKAVVFLASADADYITGACLRVDGGFWFPRRPASSLREE